MAIMNFHNKESESKKNINIYSIIRERDLHKHKSIVFIKLLVASVVLNLGLIVVLTTYIVHK